MSQTKTDTNFDEPTFNLHKAVYEGNFEAVRAALALHTPIDELHWQTGMTPLHIAVGTDRLVIARYLVQQGAKFTSDPEGRMPSIIAVECQVSDEMCDWVVEAEGKAMDTEATSRD